MSRVFKTQQALDSYLAKLKNPHKSIYYGFEVPPGGISGAEIERIQMAKKVQAEGQPHPQQETPAPVFETPQEPQKTEEEKQHNYYDVNSQYEWAKKAEVGNVGEDLAGSARHKRNKDRVWGSLEEYMGSLKEGSLIEKRQLEKAFPIDLSDKISDDVKVNMGIYESSLYLKNFPNNPSEKCNELYAKTFKGIQEIVAKAIENKQQGSLTRTQVQDLLKDTVKKAREGYASKELPYDFYSKMVNYHNSLLPGKARSPFNRMSEACYADLDTVLAEKGIELWRVRSAVREAAEKPLDRMTEDNKKVMEVVYSNWNKSLFKAMRGEKTKGKTQERRKHGETIKEDSFYKNVKLMRKSESPGILDRSKAEELLVKESGFRGIQYGNSMDDNKRKEHLLNAATAFSDLSRATGIPVKKMSLGGKLGISFGARGTGRAMAHYEPKENIIAMTRDSGHGALAHEWAHALDYSARKGNLENSASVSSAVEKAKIAIRDSGFTERLRGNDTFKKLSLRQKSYWSSSDEVFARTFEKYVEHKVAKSGEQNTYLVAGVDSDFWPNKEELEKIAPVLDELVNKLKE